MLYQDHQQAREQGDSSSPLSPQNTTKTINNYKLKKKQLREISGSQRKSSKNFVELKNRGWTNRSLQEALCPSPPTLQSGALGHWRGCLGVSSPHSAKESRTLAILAIEDISAFATENPTLFSEAALSCNSGWCPPLCWYPRDQAPHPFIMCETRAATLPCPLIAPGHALSPLLRQPLPPRDLSPASQEALAAIIRLCICCSAF